MAVQKKKISNAQKDLCRMITPQFRVSYPALHKVSKLSGKYEVTMLYPKTQEIAGTTVDGKPVTLKEIIRNAKVAEFGSKENWPEGLVSPVIDGDLPKYASKEGYKGNWVVKVTSNEGSKPGLVDQDMNPIVESAEFYPGCYARAFIFARVWEYMGKQGVQLIVDHVQKISDGKSFGGKKPVEQVFNPIGAAEETDSDDTDEMEF